ncbi:hypothetical protein AVDCRST_MAG92-1188 [uncultured Coleofasciculus sp.]|uniref:Uncharacterized protein n=1 Tax=uncultured Coleofasciculus sp. TaxID=1267456 RepID=A0A6J4HXB8_9CYAN|nr:hypothetical protein AVDCRST_MAG92-1188 [uncultured Coleofasciculus sp.]
MFPFAPTVLDRLLRLTVRTLPHCSIMQLPKSNYPYVSYLTAKSLEFLTN